MSESIKSKIMAKIKSMPENEVFTLNDFSDIAEVKTVSKTLERISSTNDYIVKIIRGVFCKRSNSKPEAHKVALALARANKWTIAPCGRTATFMLGVDTEAPKQWTFVSNGNYREYTILGYNITFKHTSSKFLDGLSNQTALLVQGIKHFGEEHMPESIKIWAKNLSKSDKKQIIKESKSVTEWIHKRIKTILD